MQRWWVPVLAAVAVLGVVGAGVWLATGSDETGGGFAGGGSDTGAGAPPYSGTEPDEPGSEPGDPGAEVPPPDDGGDGGAGPDVIALDSYYRYDDRHLALNYYNGIPECYGKAGEPRVEEDGERVVVTVPRTPPTGGKDTACIDIAVAGSVKVALEKPLGDRPVVDGGTGRRLDEAASPNDEEQAY